LLLLQPGAATIKNINEPHFNKMKVGGTCVCTTSQAIIMCAGSHDAALLLACCLTSFCCVAAAELSLVCHILSGVLAAACNNKNVCSPIRSHTYAATLSLISMPSISLSGYSGASLLFV
jgi:hypothetical protein